MTASELASLAMSGASLIATIQKRVGQVGNGNTVLPNIDACLEDVSRYHTILDLKILAYTGFSAHDVFIRKQGLPITPFHFQLEIRAPDTDWKFTTAARAKRRKREIVEHVEDFQRLEQDGRMRFTPTYYRDYPDAIRVVAKVAERETFVGYFGSYKSVEITGGRDFSSGTSLMKKMTGGRPEDLRFLQEQFNNIGQFGT